MDKNKLDQETRATLANRERLFTNRNLLYWYKKLYEKQFSGLGDILNKQILEIGSGASPLKLYYPNVKSSDIMKLDYLDYVFDAQKIDSFGHIKDESLDIITMTNVLHHLKDPCDFLLKASRKLKKGGSLILTEPYFSIFSKIVYLYLHPEPTDLNIKKPELAKVEGPLSSANIALPYLIFNGKWSEALRGTYLFSQKNSVYFSAVSYMATGGISRRLPIPHFLYKGLFNLDIWLAGNFPRIFSSFFIMNLVKK